jgi:hypothetical protein
MSVHVKADQIGHFHGFVKASPMSMLPGPPGLGKGGTCLSIRPIIA